MIIGYLKRKQERESGGSLKPVGWAAIYEEIASENQRRLNWRAMNYFVRHKQWQQAAKCRDRVGCYNAAGPA